MKTHLDPLEAEISRTKRELNDLFRQANLASRAGHAAEAHRQEVALLEKELENIQIIARYLEPICPPVARALRRWHAQMASRFLQLKDARDPTVLQRWVAQELVPHLRRSEQLAHLAATSARIRPRKAATPFVWPVAVDLALKGMTGTARHDHAARRA